ncbi:phosphatidic acid phosphatase type 2/haloperoxidase [Staphylotrichum tortipilum]|uniref:Phosphatidic acid phosphatase type 2/haloperoxidase n=1 Tax=Staphylotrichum tortipilum TaxID=2831512 RepID=A0AAN6RTP5_9PEZI|nr:phosphatidic acid phosphatase type 2/haloperoxidase [Staphylotrichum longicolle]
MAPPRTARGEGARGGVWGSVGRFWRRTYASDYVGFALLLTAYLAIQFFVEPFHRMFSLSDLRIAFPHAEIERVPMTHDFIYALFLPLLLLTFTNVLTRAPAHKHHVTILGLAISLILTSFLTDAVKNTVGRPRPDLLARCAPRAGTPRDQLVTIDVCTETNHHKLHDGWRSFPSGHSSFSFAGLGYLALFWAAQLRIFAHSHSGTIGGLSARAEKVVRGDLIRALLCLAPLLAATMIAISRCQDYRHDVWDVCVGGLLGWTVAYWSYRRYWPRLGSGRCEEPYAGPGPEGGEEGYGRVRDEEEGGAGGRDNVGMDGGGGI